MKILGCSGMPRFTMFWHLLALSRTACVWNFGGANNMFWLWPLFVRLLLHVSGVVHMPHHLQRFLASENDTAFCKLRVQWVQGARSSLSGDECFQAASGLTRQTENTQWTQLLILSSKVSTPWNHMAHRFLVCTTHLACDLNAVYIKNLAAWQSLPARLDQTAEIAP